MVFDSQDNLHVYSSNKYYFRPASELTGSKEQLYDSIEVIAGQSCNDCNAFKKFLKNAGIAFTETSAKGSDLVVNIRKAGKEYLFTNPSTLDIARIAGFAFAEDGGYYVGDNANNGVVYFGLDSNEKPFMIVQKDDGFYKKTYNGKTMSFISGSYWSEEKILPVSTKSFAGINPGSNFASLGYKTIDILVKKDSVDVLEKTTIKNLPLNLDALGSGDSMIGVGKDVIRAVPDYLVNLVYKISDYDLYTTNEKSSDTFSTATASQLIPGAVLYAPIEQGEETGKVEGELAKYIVEQKPVTEDDKNYYYIKADLSEYLKATNGHIKQEQITGTVDIGSRTAQFIVNVINMPLKVFDSAASENTIDISQEAAMTFDGSWYVVNFKKHLMELSDKEIVVKEEYEINLGNKEHFENFMSLLSDLKFEKWIKKEKKSEIYLYNKDKKYFYK